MHVSLLKPPFGCTTVEARVDCIQALPQYPVVSGQAMDSPKTENNIDQLVTFWTSPSSASQPSKQHRYSFQPDKTIHLSGELTMTQSVCPKSSIENCIESISLAMVQRKQQSSNVAAGL